MELIDDKLIEYPPTHTYQLENKNYSCQLYIDLQPKPDRKYYDKGEFENNLTYNTSIIISTTKDSFGKYIFYTKISRELYDQINGKDKKYLLAVLNLLIAPAIKGRELSIKDKQKES